MSSRLNLTTELLALGDEKQANGFWLDSGCGGNQTVNFLATSGFDAFGIDLTPKVPTPDPRILTGDMREIPLDAGMFDFVIAECSLSVCGDAEKSLKEMRRVLKPGGTLYIADVYFPEGSTVKLSSDDPSTLDNWQTMIHRAGFDVADIDDQTQAWTNFYLKLLWEGKNLKDTWLKGYKDPLKGSGYFLLHGKG